MNRFEQRAAALFEERFGYASREAFFAPGRVNLIGEHIDYNGGRVMPCSLSLGTYAAASPRGDGMIRLVSADAGSSASIEVGELTALPLKPAAFRGFGWAAYPLGVAAQLIARGYGIGGFDMAVCGSLPRGSGLSSSASLEVLTCAVLRSFYAPELGGVEAARVSLAAERDCAGVNCGIMDQFVCAMGRRGAAILLDTATLEYGYFPFELGSCSLLIMNTKKPRRLADSKYNERRAECEEALRLINAHNGMNAASLCELSPEGFDSVSGCLPPLLLKRARHAVTENARTLQASAALIKGDMEAFGRLLNASHDSLRYDYEVTGSELDAMVTAARRQPGVLGARMTGAGFGGCAIALAPTGSVESIAEAIRAEYDRATGYCSEIYAAETGEAPFGKDEV